MVSIRSKVVPKATSKTDKRGNLSETHRRVLNPIRDVPFKMTRARVALASKVRATKTKAIKESGGPAEPPDKSSSSRGTKSKSSVKTNAPTKVVKSRKKAKVVYRSPSPRFVYKEDSQEREYEQYVPKPVPIVPPSIPLPPAENPYACLRDRYLGEGIIGDIIRYSPDQQTLHLWQQVSLDTYNLATRLLYSRGVTLSTPRGYTSFLCGSHTRRRRADGPKCPRLRSKQTLLLLVTAIKFGGNIDLAIPSVYLFANIPVELFQNLSRVWFAIPGNIKMQDVSYPPSSARRWLGKLSLAEVRYEGNSAPSVAPSQTPNSVFSRGTNALFFLRTIYDGAQPLRTRYIPRGLPFLVYENAFWGDLCVKAKDELSLCMSRDAKCPELTAKYASIVRLLRNRKLTRLLVYGVTQRPGVALVTGVRQAIHIVTEPLRVLLDKPEYGDVQGDERHCQVVVNAFFQELVAIVDVRAKIEFKLISELPPFFPTG